MEYFWKASHQIVMLTPDKPSNEADIEGWGSGFILEYKGRQFFITCDHNLHMLDDFANGERSGEDFQIAIIANYKDPQNPLSTGFVTIPGFYYFDSIDLKTPEIMDLKDIAFAELKSEMPLPLLTNQLNHYDGSVAVKAGELKLFIKEETMSEAIVGKDYVITGCICNRIVDGIRMERRTIFREGIKYTGRTHMGSFLVFEYPDIINVEEWEGLSGSPIFDEGGKLVGMVNEVVDGGREIYVTPINHILRLIDYTIKSENVNEKMKKPLVSIVIPVYKVPEQYLRQCIESCINQTMRGIEIILVDDGSPDDCGKICDEYAKKDARVKVIHKENGGLAAARNTGQDAAIGETLMFLDGDDYLELDCCEIAYSKLKDNDVELVMFDQYVNYPNSQMEQKSFYDGLGERLFVGEECRKLQARVLDFNGRIAMAFMKLIRLDYLRKYNIRHIDELRQGAEGFVFNIQLYEHLERAYYIDKPLLHYIYNGQSISHTASVKNNILIVRCLEWIDEYVKSSRNTMYLHSGVLNRMLYVICTTAITGYFNPYNRQSHKEKVAGLSEFMSEPLVREAMSNAPREGLNFQRRIILTLISMKMYRAISLLGWLRRKQLENK